MYSYQQADGWWVTTPMIVGDADQLEQARHCAHVFETDEKTRHVEQGQECYIERCTRCVATRGKHRPLSQSKEQEHPDVGTDTQDRGEDSHW